MDAETKSILRVRKMTQRGHQSAAAVAPVVLVDTGTPKSTTAIADGPTRIGASWTDVTDVLLSHDHPDHIGSLPGVRTHAPRATVWGNAPLTGRGLNECDVVRGLTVLATPGHTAGHVSLLHESGALLVGDLVGNQGGALSRPPARFTDDAEEAERSLSRIASMDVDRLLTSHGAELADPSRSLGRLLH